MLSGAYQVTSKSTLTVVCDAGPIIHLDELDATFLFKDFHQVMVPTQVWNEVQVYRPGIWNAPNFTYRTTETTIATDSSFQVLVRTFSLDLGEQAALSLIKEYPNATFLTDDAAARLAATTLGLRVHGTVGVLLRSIRRKQYTRSQVLEILRTLPTRSTLHIKSSLLDEIIERLQEGDD